MILKSHQVNLDPEPWVNTFGNRVRSPGRTDDGEFTYDPRPEFEPTRDPKPWLYQGALRVRPPSRLSEHYTWAPRREQFDTPVNRALTDFRKHWEPLAHTPGPREAQIYLEVTDLDGGKKQPLYWSTEEIDHARRVLTRLANCKAATDG